jgi:hypothetical protein
MRKLAVFLIVLCSITTATLGQPIQGPQGAWLQDGLKWSKAPKKINPKLSSARGAVLYFGSDHNFTLIYTTINRVPGEYEVICGGCGQVVYSGSWELGKQTIKVKYRLVSRTVDVPGEQLPGPVKEDTAKIEDDAVLFLGYSFHRSTALSANIRDFIPPQ